MNRVFLSFVAALAALSVAIPHAAGVGRGVNPRDPQSQQQQKPAQQQSQGRQPSSPQQQPTFRAGVNVVRVDVIVTDKHDQHVVDLKASDFDLWEDGKPQPIDTFRLVNFASEPQPADATKEIRNFDDEESETGRESSRLIVLMLDDYHVSATAAMRVRGALRHFVQSELQPSDLVAVMYPLMPVSALKFSRDRQALAEQIDRFEGRRGIYMVRNEAESSYAGAPAEVVEQIRTQVSLSALESLVTHLGGLREGRKSVVLVSEGFFIPPTEQRDLEHVYDAANRSNTAIYTLDPGGLSLVPNNWMKDSLSILAENTDGRAILNRNDLDSALAVVLHDSSSYYLLGYNSPAPSDGKFHEIKVKVKRPGVEVRARKGYWAPSAEEAARATAPPRPEPSMAVTQALSSLTATDDGRSIRTWVGVSPGENGKTRIAFAWKPSPLPADAGSTRRPARVSLTATAADGTNCFSGVSELPVAAAGGQPGSKAPGAVGAAADTPTRVSFDAPPGKVQIKVNVESRSGEALETDVRDIAVPDFSGGQVRLTTPAVFLARTPREYRALVADSSNAVPTPDRQFSRTDRVLIKVEAYGPARSATTVTARLLNRNGDPMIPLSLASNTARPAERSLELPLVGLAPGIYMVEFRAQAEGGEAKEVVAVKVGG